MEAVYLDTHVVVWLFAGEVEKLSSRVVEIIEDRELLISPMVSLELRFLYEIGRLRYDRKEVLSSLERTVDLRVDDISFAVLTEESAAQDWTRDPFDRMIVAHAKCSDNATLLSRDGKILEHYDRAVW